MAALSVGTIADRLNADRMPTVVELLKREAATISPRIHPFDASLRRPAQSLSGSSAGALIRVAPDGTRTVLARSGLVQPTGLAVGKTPLEVEMKLEQVVPAAYKRHAHHWLILHGRYVCVAKVPKCPACVINDLCEFRHKTRLVDPKAVARVAVKAPRRPPTKRTRA